MATGFPVKANYATGDILTATNMNDLAGTLNSVTTSTLSVSAGKNAVINSGFDVWQRGTSINLANTSSNYSADRWLGVSATTGTVTRQTTGDTTNLPNIQYAARAQRTAGQTGTGSIGIYQPFESTNSIPFAGKAVTLSFYARAGANYSSASSALAANLYTGTGTDQNPFVSYTGSANPVTGTATLTTTWQRFTYTGTLASTATELYLSFTYTPVGTAGANDYFEITGVQLEVGSVATAFARNASTLQGELAACQRYYYRVNAITTGDWMSLLGTGGSATTVFFNMPIKSSMRVLPTSIDYANVRVFDGINPASTVTALVIDGGNTEVVVCKATVASGLTQYRPYFLLANTLSSYYGVSAEL